MNQTTFNALIVANNPVHFLRAASGFEQVSQKVIPRQLLFFDAEWKPVIEPCDFLSDTMSRGCGTHNAIKNYGSALKRYFRACEKSGVPWKEATYSDLLAYRRSLLHSLAGRTVNLHFTALKGLYSTCVYRGSLEVSPFPTRERGERNPFRAREDEVLPRAIPLDHLEIIFSKLSPTYRFISALALTTGLREVEFEEFQLSHLPIVPDRYTPFTYFRLRRKGGPKKTVAIPTLLVDELHRYIDFGERARIREKFHVRGDPIKSRDFAFLTSRGNGVRANYISKAFGTAVRKAALSDRGYSFHGLRHTYALTMAKQLQRAHEENIRQGKPGINVGLALRNLMGHAHQSTTEIYLTALRQDEAVISDSITALYQGLARIVGGQDEP